MIGGGPGAFIGEVHRRAAALDGLATLVAGAFSSDPERSRRQGRTLGLDPRRAYASWQAMAEAEAALPAEERVEVVSIVTPNHLHFPVARAFIERGVHVVCDKPMTTTLEDAEALARLVAERGVVFALTHTYTGYAMVKEARALVRSGVMGPIRRVMVDYLQGWLATPLEADGHKQATWRTDPDMAGAGALGDIGSHAESLVRWVTGLEPERLCADVTTFVEGRRVDDDTALLVRYRGGARGTITVSQVAVGEDNALRLRVYGAEGSLDWRQEDPEALVVHRADGTEEVRRRGRAGLAPSAARASRLPAGHPEGFLEAFANVYGDALRAVGAVVGGGAPDPDDLDVPTAADGAAGVHFIEAALRSSREGGWVDAAYAPPGAGSR
ncbi:MAG: Gfo/Idh/MocA family oxidoreductase [Gemmatimonadetes bacterium]|nr:Gfo/Idh/MocA family oxidoreductase [Gemmatimonadota bacterium]